MVTTIRKVTGGDHPFYEFACLSTDTKPTSLVPENSICHEIDTGKHFYCSNGEWKELPPKGGSGGGGLPDNFPAEGSTNANKFLGFDANGDYTAKDAPSGGGAEKFVVTLTQENDTWTANKTVAEIVAAYEANKVVVAKYPRDGLNIDIPLSMAMEYSGAYFAMFIGFMNAGNDNKIVVVQCGNEGSGDAITITQQTIPTSTNAPLIVTLTADESTGNLVGDKTYKEVYDAFNASQTVTFKSTFSGFTIATDVLSVGYSNDGYSVAIVFCGSIVEAEGTENAYVSIHVN